MGHREKYAKLEIRRILQHPPSHRYGDWASLLYMLDTEILMRMRARTHTPCNRDRRPFWQGHLLLIIEWDKGNGAVTSSGQQYSPHL